MRLGDYLLGLSDRRREAGIHDCATVPADWAVLLGLPDPISAWRGYESEDEAQAIIRESGGLDAVFDAGFASSNVGRREGDPVEGDIGVIRIAGQDAASIFTGRRWVFVGNRGIGFATVAPHHIIAVWATGRG